MSRNHNRPRVAVTGFYAGFAAAHGWRELAASSAPNLRAEFERENADATAPRCMPDFECVIARVLREMQCAGLWNSHGLAVDPQRVAVTFATSKSEFAKSLRPGNGRVGSDAPQTPSPALPLVKGKGVLPDSHSIAALEEWETPGLWNRASDWPAIALARTIGATGARIAPVAACATGAHAIALATQQIEDGYADVALAGALETPQTPLVLAAYASLGALSDSGAMRPFDRRRDGFVAGAGAGCVVLENEDKARRHGATIYGYLSGWSMQADATSMTAFCPSGDSITRAIEVALRRADLAAVDYINAHGTATQLNDVTETRAIKSALGATTAASSTKPLTGHLMGAAGAVEAVLCLAAMRENYAPPTLHLEEPDEECDLDYIALRGRAKNISSALSLSYGFGGHIGVLIFERETK